MLILSLKLRHAYRMEHMYFMKMKRCMNRQIDRLHDMSDVQFKASVAKYMHYCTMAARYTQKFEELKNIYIEKYGDPTKD